MNDIENEIILIQQKNDNRKLKKREYQRMRRALFKLLLQDLIMSQKIQYFQLIIKSLIKIKSNLKKISDYAALIYEQHRTEYTSI
jgi:hypothetical protein